jgi:pimeloyl-ACP methyl ester carboxylesterase
VTWLGVVLLSTSFTSSKAFLPPNVYHVAGGRGSHSVLLCTSDFGSIPVKEGTVQVARTLEGTESLFDLSYKLVRPMALSSRKAAPIIALHGGTSVPSNCLYPLAKCVPYRSILFYDQPTDLDDAYYSIEQAVDDLEVMLKKLSIRCFHLYGQYFGGILAYEYLKRCAERGQLHGDDQDEGCLSLIFSSKPTNVVQVEGEAERLAGELSSPEVFRETHQCRTSEMPKRLADAYAASGTGAVWRGTTTAIKDYVAQAPVKEAAIMPSTMVMRGEHDFVTEICCKDWKEVLNSRSVRIHVLEGCSHHGLLENGVMYGEIVDSFFQEYE